jgi:hypothetical protein
MQGKYILTAAGRRLRGSLLTRAAWVGVVVGLVLSGRAASLAGPPGDAGANGAVKFEPVATFPPMLNGRVQGVPGSLHVAGAAQGTLYAATDTAGKARVSLLRNNVIVADLTVPASRDRLHPDWPGSFVFWLGGLPVVAISWKLENDVGGIEDLAFWAAEGGGRSLGGLPASSRSACRASDPTPKKDCGRCGASSVIPLGVRLVGVEQNRARFVQQLAAAWYYYFDAAAETFEQDYLLTATGLAPDGQARRTRNAIPQPQAKERVTGLLREYFRLAKSQSREQIAGEFLTCFQQLADLAPDFGQGHYNVGCMHALLGNKKDAVASVTKAISLDPKYRKVARRDPDLASVRDDPELVRLLGDSGK